ncbi:Pyridine nucleotide-disulfide oxidoreductase [uncultured Gammaproteobacteria bacterium]
MGLGLSFSDLYEHDGLVRLDQGFCAYVAVANAALAERLAIARAAPDALEAKAESALLLELAPHLETFIAELFPIKDALGQLVGRHTELAPLYRCKRLFVQRRATRELKPDQAAALDGEALTIELAALIGPGFIGPGFDELAFATAVIRWSEDDATHAAALSTAARYAAWALHSPAGRTRHGAGILFQTPHKLDHDHLVPVETVVLAEGVTGLRMPLSHQRQRQGFDLTDRGCDLTSALDQANYCIWCHNQGKDSCSKGLRERKTNDFQKTPFGVTLIGCPLGEKISEMHTLKAEGWPLAALAMIVVDNPLCAATGHRICNECMKACIYQKQEPVDIPQVETRTLKDVLELPWGFEIYGLLTRWNPLNLRRPLPLPDSGYKVLVVGLGPAGFGLSHHLLNEGHAVVAIDGLKIEPLPEDLSGVAPSGAHEPFRPIRDVEAELYERLDQRVMAGFGGVAEYGITVRWNKNFLKIIRLLLERRRRMAIIGGVRFGGGLTIEDAFAAGFDHIALCAGAGKPTIIPMSHGLARGVRQASDFLMSLQLTGAAKAESLANLQVRLPIVVIGGGLTAIDTATESLAYYPVQVEKLRRRVELLSAHLGDAAVWGVWSKEEREIAQEFLAHAAALRAEREAAAREGREPQIQSLLDGWGGSTVVYRRKLTESPSYTLNHEEVALAMAEGIRFVEQATPVAVAVDRFGHAAALKIVIKDQGEQTLPARTVLVAAGTQPNTVLARENPDTITLDGKYFQALDENGTPVRPQALAKPEAVQVLMALREDGRAISFFGDLHPSFSGNVVKAMTGAKRGYPVVSRVLRRRAPSANPGELLRAMNHTLRATVHHVEWLTPDIIEIVVHAPRAARHFQPGQFYRLQNFESRAPHVNDTSLTMEGLALTGAWVDKGRGLLSMIVLEMGGSSSLCALLKPGEPVVLMGPAGAPTHIPHNETVCLVGGGLGNAVLFSIGQACREQSNRVIYFAGYKKIIDRYKVEQIEAAADHVVWCCDQAPGFTPDRPGDSSFVGNIVAAMAAYAAGDLGIPPLPLDQVDRIIAIGSDRMMDAVGKARHGVLKPYLKVKHLALGSINSPMQCMMKEICAQCLQTHRDPVTGEETVVFSCFNQDQELDRVDFNCLRERLNQNRMQEKLTALWIQHCLSTLNK